MYTEVDESLGIKRNYENVRKKVKQKQQFVRVKYKVRKSETRFII